jgi:chemotaxis signal transduction protein
MRRAALTRQVQALRRDFDRGFADPMRPPPPESLDLLRIRLGGEPWAVALTDIAGLHAARRVTPIPTRAPALIGLAGFRGVPIAIYDLPALIGLAPVGTPRWLMLAAERQVAFAFADLDGHLRIDAAAILPVGAEGGAAWTRGFVDGRRRLPILHLPALLARLTPLEGNDR